MNESLFRYLNDLVGQSEFLDKVVWFCADFLALIIFFVLAYFIAVSKNKKKAIASSVVILFSALLAWAFADVIKYIFPSPRPFVVLDSVNLLFEHGGYDSFPSGHTTFMVAFAVMSVFYVRRLGLLMLILAFVTGGGSSLIIACLESTSTFTDATPASLPISCSIVALQWPQLTVGIL